MKPIPINFYLERPGKPKSSVIARFSYKGKPYKFYPKISVISGDWSDKKMRVDHRKALAWETNDRINIVEKAINNVLSAFQKKDIDPPGSPEMKFAIKKEMERMDNEEGVQPDSDFVDDFYRPWILKKSAKKKEYFKRRWDTTVDNALAVRPALRFEEINDDFFHDYVAYLIDEQENVNNTINGKVKRMQQLCRDAMKWGHNVNPHFNDFRFPGERIPPIYLLWDEVLKIEGLNNLEKEEAYIRDRFLFRCYTGVRISDMEFMHKGMIARNAGMRVLRFDKVKQSSGHTIFLPDKAYKLWERNGFDFNSSKYSSQQWESKLIKRVLRIAKINREIQILRHRGSEEVVERMPMWKVVSSHTARRTFGRAWYDRGGDLNKLREYFDHSDLSTTLRYVGVEKDETNREAARLFG